MELPQIVLIVCVVLFTLTAAAWDLRTKRIPKSVTVTAFALALVYHVVFGVIDGGLAGVGESCLFAAGGFATGFGVLFVIWLVGGGGGGDVKLMGALGTWLGAWMTFQVFVLSAILVMVASVGVLTWQMITGGFGKTQRRFLGGKRSTASRGASKETRARLAQKEKTRRRLMPYGIPVALATWVILAAMVLTGTQGGN